MRIIAKSALVKFWRSLPPSEQRTAAVALNAWYEDATEAEWSNFQDVKRTFNAADWVGDGKVVFDVGGNKYRVVCLAGFKSKRLFVLFVGTHRQYDAIDVTRL